MHEINKELDMEALKKKLSDSQDVYQMTKALSRKMVQEVSEKIDEVADLEKAIGDVCVGKSNSVAAVAVASFVAAMCTQFKEDCATDDEVKDIASDDDDTMMMMIMFHLIRDIVNGMKRIEKANR